MKQNAEAKSRRGLAANQSIAAAVATCHSHCYRSATQRDSLKQVFLMTIFQHAIKYAN